MSRNSEFTLFSKNEVDNVKMVELRYAGSTFSFCIFLPNDKTEIGTIEKKMTPLWLKGLVETTSYTPIHLELPKFTARLPVNLKAMLEQVGFRDWSKLGRLGQLKSGLPLQISSAFHEACIKVCGEVF